MKKICIVFVLMLSILDANIEEAKKVYNAKDFKKAFLMFQQLSKEGNIESNYYLGNMYQYGNGIRQNYKKAFNYYSRASTRENKKNLKSKFSLALLYSKGLGVKQDYKKAFELFEILDKKNIGVAQYFMGLMYSQGNGVQKNYEKAITYIIKGCNKKVPRACYDAGYSYEKSNGVKKNYTLSKTYYKKGCELGSHESCEALKNMKEPLSFFRTREYYILMGILLVAGWWRLWKKKQREGLLDEKKNTLK